MFRLSESDYRRLEPLAMKVYKRSARSTHVARLMESKVGRRALVDMMFLEADDPYGEVIPLAGKSEEKIIEAAHVAKIDAETKSALERTGVPYVKGKVSARSIALTDQLQKALNENDELKGQIQGFATVVSAYERDAEISAGRIQNLIVDREKLTKIREYLTGTIKDVEGNNKALADRLVAIKKYTDPKEFSTFLEKIKEDPRYAKAFATAIKEKKMLVDKETTDAIRESLSFTNRVKSYFSRISKWFKGKLDPILKKIYSFFVEKNDNGTVKIKWLHVAIVAVVIIAIGFLLFGTSAGEKVRNFVLNAIKAGINGIRSAVRYVLGKGGAPKEAIDETEGFLDEATA
jgi:hypothetical protein